MRYEICVLSVVLGITGLCRAADPPAQTFTVQEMFGVAHPEQLVDFDLAQPIDAAQSYLIGPDGAEVPYQLLDGGKKLALRTNLPANTTKTWTLKRGRAPQAVQDGVTVTETPEGIEIATPRTAVRVFKGDLAELLIY